MTEDKELRWFKTHCSRMDHGGCALLVGVRDNRIVKIKGDPEGILNKGYVCPKGLASADRLTHPSRLRSPLRRVGNRGEGNWERISWADAIEEMASKFNGIKARHGARSVIFGQGMPKGLELFGLIRLATLFGSPNVIAVQDVCHAPREVSGVHTCGFYPVVDFHHKSDLIVLWGSNVTSSNEEGQICSLLLQQQEQGTPLMVVDPRRTELAKKADLWLQIRPGTDHALAMSFLNVIIEEGLYDKAFVEEWTFGFQELSDRVGEFTPEKISAITWVPADLIRDAARRYASCRPAAIQWGNPIEQTVNAFDAARAIVCLMAVCGNLDVPGGNIQPVDPNVLSLARFVRSNLLPSKRKEMLHAFHGTIPKMMTVPPTYFRKAVLEGTPYPVRGAYIQCANPLLAYADSSMTFDALMKLDFLAVSDIVLTPTAALADLVLPAATSFEFNDIGHYGLGHGYILARPKVVDPPEECWPDIRIINELGKLISPPGYWFDSHEDLLEEVLKPSGLNFAAFAEKGYLKGPDRFRKYRDGGFSTPTGKVEIMLSQAEKMSVPPLPCFSGMLEEEDPDYPLVLTSCKSRYYLHSSYRWIERLRESRPSPKTEIHPETAERYGIREGGQIVVETRKGAITQVAHLTPAVHPRVVCVAYGWWHPLSDGQFDWKTSNYNMLTSADKLGKEFGTPNLKGISCRVRKA
ncbi:MAG: molybdopterin-dependent oxidoreductase [Desulfobacterales bacterium]|nr:molybdopterin-dependent oxidoreductase [Desulfobacterales bacterium]